MHKGYRLNNSYVFEKIIGTGGMGEVWSAKRTDLGDRVAIKVLKLNSYQNKETIRDQLKKEAKITSLLNHPNICKVFEFIEQDDVCFLVMELLEGMDLQSLLRIPNLLRGVDCTGLALFICKEVIRALDTAHNVNHLTIARILHRDIKPGNIFLTKHGEIKLLDLGVAKAETDLDNTKTTDTFFSLHYTSPELWENGNYNVSKYSAANDIYSLGLVFYEIIAGEKAFKGAGKAFFEKLESGSISSIREFCESGEVDSLFSKWTNRIPSERFANSKSLLNILTELVLDYQINESVIQEIFKKVEKLPITDCDQTLKNEQIEIEKRITMKLNKTGNLQDSTGREAEEDVLAIIGEVYGKDYARIFVNSTIPQRNKTPDFVIPVFDKDGVFKLIIVECKASTTIYPDGSTKFSDPFAQILAYRERIALSLKTMNKECEIVCYVVFPNRNDIPKNLKDGRDNVIWMTLPSFKECLKGFRPVTPFDKKYELVQMIYASGEIVQKYRDKRTFSNEQKRILDWKFGGTRKIGGLAGTGKSLLLAKKMIKDISESQGDNFLYLTHNKNLVLKFQEYLCSFLDEEGIEAYTASEKRSPIKIEYKLMGRNITITLCTFDAFSTSCISQWMDELLFNKKSYGPLYSLICAQRGTSPKEVEFRREREALIGKLKPLINGKEDLCEKYTALYVDEFQDCRIDPSRLLLPVLFVKKNADGETNLCFTEDVLQSFVKYDVLKEIDDSFENIRRKDFASYADLGLPNMSNKSKILDTIYRTPEKIFKASLNLLENQGGLLKARKNEILALKYKNQVGSLSYIDESELKDSVSFMLNERQRFPHELIFIETLENSQSSKNIDELFKHYDCNDVTSTNPPSTQKINFFHEYNVRGLEAKVVYLIINEEVASKSNYIYTLMCRTQTELILVRSDSLSRDKFQQFFELLSEQKYRAVS